MTRKPACTDGCGLLFLCFWGMGGGFLTSSVLCINSRHRNCPQKINWHEASRTSLLIQVHGTKRLEMLKAAREESGCEIVGISRSIRMSTRSGNRVDIMHLGDKSRRASLEAGELISWWLSPRRHKAVIPYCFGALGCKRQHQNGRAFHRQALFMALSTT